MRSHARSSSELQGITGVVNLKQFYLVTLTLSLAPHQTEGHLERMKITVTTDDQHEEFANRNNTTKHSKRVNE